MDNRTRAVHLMAAWNGVPVQSLLEKDAKGELKHITLTAWVRVYEAAETLVLIDASPRQ